MSQQTSQHQLTQDEILAILGALDNRLLLSGLRKVWAKEADYWEAQMRQEMLSNKPYDERATKGIEYAAKAEQCLQIEAAMRKAVGL